MKKYMKTILKIMGKGKELCRSRLGQSIHFRMQEVIKLEGRWSGKRIATGKYTSKVVYHFVRNMYNKTKPVEIVDEIHCITCWTEICLDTL